MRVTIEMMPDGHMEARPPSAEHDKGMKLKKAMKQKRLQKAMVQGHALGKKPY